MLLRNMKYVKPSEEQIARCLAAYTFETHEAIKPVTLKAHFWYLFRYGLIGAYWETNLAALCEKELLDRQAVLSEVLEASTRFSIPAFTAHCFTILETFAPTSDELLDNQQALLTVLSSGHSKSVTRTLKYIKQICNDERFDSNAFVSFLPFVFAWDVKSVINGAITQVDAVMKHHPQQKRAIASSLVQALAFPDEAVQIKVLKTLEKHRLVPDIMAEILPYADRLFSGTLQMLAPLDCTTSTGESMVPILRLDETRRITLPHSFEEMVFFFAQVFDQNTRYDFDLFLALLLQIDKQLSANNVDMLLPAFHNALKVFKSSLNVERMVSRITLAMAQAFLYYATLLNRRVDGRLDPIPMMYHNLLAKVRRNVDARSGYPDDTIDFEAPTSNGLYLLYDQRLASMLQAIWDNEAVLPLSTPTHAPCWIAATTLFERMMHCQHTGLKIDSYDFQIALSRVVDDAASIDAAMEAEFSALFRYLFHGETLCIEKINHPDYWLPAILRRREKTACDLFMQAFADTSDPLLQPIGMKVVRERWKDRNGGTGWLKRFEVSRPRGLAGLPLDTVFHLTGKIPGALAHYDQNVILLITPTIPYFVLDAVVDRTSIRVTETLPDIWDDFHDAAYPYPAVGCLSADKTERLFSAELWIKAVSEGTMKSDILGTMLGTLESGEYAPLKRFTDLVTEVMLGVSTMHNKALEILLGHMLLPMADTPIKGTKKLLEIYREVLVKNESSAPEAVKSALQGWSDVKSLRPIIKKADNSVRV